MRWFIAENKRRIASVDFDGHKDDVEMSGEQVSGIVTYGSENGEYHAEKRLIYPMFRLQPDVTQSSYQLEDCVPSMEFGGAERFDRVEFDGVLSVFTHVGDLKIVHRFYPSVTLPVFYERVELYNGGKEPYAPVWERYRKIDGRIACEGWVYTECVSDVSQRKIMPKERLAVTFAYSARFANRPIPTEENSLEQRIARVEELLCECDLTTGDDVVDTMFAFAKLRVGESIFRTRKGRVNSPGGTNYYAAVWCNDQCEYSTPWFAYTGDKNEYEAADNAMGWYEPYMNEEFEPIPSSVISEGTDYWNGRRDRGDASMYLYGNSRFFLERGELPDERRMKMLEWCAEYTLRQITEEGIVVSDTDELEYRLSSGVNLATSSLAYGAFGYFATLLERAGRSEDAKKFLLARKKIESGIEKYFGGEVSGYRTYHYHKGCDEIRAWNCLPAYMGITDRAKETADSIDEKLWKEGSCRSTENENIMWDRSALYYIASLFRTDDKERAWKKLKEFSSTRLLGERVPYAVEAYPEFNMRHLSAESGLFCRIITDGLLDIRFDKEGFSLCPHLPEAVRKVTLNHIWCGGGYKDIEVQNEEVKIKSV